MFKIFSHSFLRLLFLAFITISVAAQNNPRFRIDDPLWEDPDQLPIPLTESLPRSEIFDFIEGSFFSEPKKNEPILPAQNVNTLGEVPNSSWFNNRVGFREMTMEELIRGPNQLDNAGTNPPYTIVGVKTQGVTPGFTIEDGSGDIYFVKFDPPAYPQLATSTEVITTKFFYAFGYNVPENYLTFIRRSDLEISPDVVLTDEEGKERPIAVSDIDRIFRRVHHLPDGTTPAVASRRIPGKPVGPFKYSGTRLDDPNDIIPHENRRELRGMRLFSAWLNHDDSRAINTLNFYQGEPGKGFIRHYLIDFGSCLGSGSIKLQSRRAGNEYMIELEPIMKAAVTFGIWDRAWRKVKYPEYPQIGRFEADYFRPELWRPEYGNPAFHRMLPQDAFWATRIIAEFTDEMVSELVKIGRITDPEAEKYLIETLIKRRDKIIQHYLPQICALDNFVISGNRLQFRDLGEKHGIYRSPEYSAEWFTYDNGSDQLKSLISGIHSPENFLDIPQNDAEFLMVRIAVDFAGADAKNSIDVYLRNSQSPKTLVGIERR